MGTVLNPKRAVRGASGLPRGGGRPRRLLDAEWLNIIVHMAAGIELTDEQVRALSQPQAGPPRLVNPRTHEAFVLLRVDQYEKLTESLYDDSPWTREELQSVAWQATERSDRDGDYAAEPPAESA